MCSGSEPKYKNKPFGSIGVEAFFSAVFNYTSSLDECEKYTFTKIAVNKCDMIKGNESLVKNKFQFLFSYTTFS